MKVLYPDLEIAKSYGKIKASLKAKGKPIPENDIWIAATCHAADLTLITADSDFDFIDPNETFCVELCHYPMLSWNRRPHGTCMVHGHCHGSINEYNTKSGELRVDVGIDRSLFSNGFVELEELYAYFVNIRNSAGCKTFQEYIDKLMNVQGFRM